MKNGICIFIFLMSIHSSGHAFVLIENVETTKKVEEEQRSYEESLGIQGESIATTMIFDDFTPPEIHAMRSERDREKKRITNMLQEKEAERKSKEGALLLRVQTQLEQARQSKQEGALQAMGQSGFSFSFVLLAGLGLAGILVSFRRGSRLMNFLNEDKA